MRLEIRIEGSELSDVLIELREVLQLVSAGVVHSDVDSALSSHYFGLTNAIRTGQHLEKKPTVRAKRKGKRNA